MSEPKENATPDIFEEERKQGRRALIRRYVVIIGFLLAAVLLVGWLREGFSDGKTKAELVKIWSDAFFVVGGLTLCLGILMWVAGEGTFDMFTYAFSMIFRLRFSKNHESFTEYRERKHGSRTGGCLYALIPGALLTVVAVVLAVLFEHVG